ncbi:MAG: endo-1,4-beta-xylanase [Streptomyces sp.]|nr:endo-1,4-beta-xylanase [Streptomyces sp.]
MRRTTRAVAVGVATAGVLAFVIPHLAGSSGRDAATAAHSAPAPTGTPLRDLAQKAGIRVGTAVNTDALAHDEAYAAEVGRDFSSVTPENVMKWEVVEPSRGTYDYTQADRLVAYAAAHGQLVRGHTLVWHNQLPSWLTSGDFGAGELREILHRHVTSEVEHFKGRIWQWDVVNEAFEEDGSYRDDIWLQKLGPGYVEDAFRWAHEADPKAVLFINDYGIEGVNAKSTALYGLVERLRKEGVPVQGVGFQGHLYTRNPAPHDIAANMARFDRLGVQTAVTEADVRIMLPAGSTDTEAQDEAYRTLLDGCLRTRNCTDFTVWGFTDKYSWVPDAYRGQGQADILDEHYRPKSAYTALARRLRPAGR